MSVRDTSEQDKQQLRAAGDDFMKQLQTMPGPAYVALWDELHDGRATTEQVIRCVMRIEKMVEDHTIKQQPLF